MAGRKRVSYSTLFVVALIAILADNCNAQNSQQDYLDGHNAARKAVGVGPMVWDTTVEAYAKNYADVRSADCSIQHSGGPYGENTYMGYGDGFSNGVDAIRYWFNEKKYYDHQNNQCTGGVDCLHYTQMVWKDSTKLGCARVACTNSREGAFFVVCNYDPPGNIDGERPY